MTGYAGEVWSGGDETLWTSVQAGQSPLREVRDSQNDDMMVFVSVAKGLKNGVREVSHIESTIFVKMEGQ